MLGPTWDPRGLATNSGPIKSKRNIPARDEPLPQLGRTWPQEPANASHPLLGWYTRCKSGPPCPQHGKTRTTSRWRSTSRSCSSMLRQRRRTTFFSSQLPRSCVLGVHSRRPWAGWTERDMPALDGTHRCLASRSFRRSRPRSKTLLHVLGCQGSPTRSEPIARSRQRSVMIRRASASAKSREVSTLSRSTLSGVSDGWW